jgi:hypothetical protein
LHRQQDLDTKADSLRNEGAASCPLCLHSLPTPFSLHPYLSLSFDTLHSSFVQEERYKSQKGNVLAGTNANFIFAVTSPHLPLVLPQNYKLMIIIGLVVCVLIGILVGIICAVAPNKVPLLPSL